MEMQQVSSVAGDVDVGTYEKVEEENNGVENLKNPLSVGEINAESVIIAERVDIRKEGSGGDFFGARIGAMYNLSKQDVTKNYQIVIQGPNQGAIKADPEDALLKEKEDFKSGWIKLSNSIYMNPNHKISTVGRVCLGEQTSHVLGPRSLAVKTLDYLEKNKREAKTLLTLSAHPNVVSIIHSDIYISGLVKYIYIAMELCHTQNLYDHVIENKSNHVPYDPQLSISQAKQLVNGLDFIHQSDIIHRDLKPYNVLFSLNKKTLKIADFGISKEMTRGRTVTKVTNARAGTDGYRAPETYNSNVISKKTDIFSLGLILHFVWSNGSHVFGDDPDDWNSNIKRNRDCDFSTLQVADQELTTDLLQWMLQFEPRKRPTTAEILRNKIFAESLVSPGAENLPTASTLVGITSEGNEPCSRQDEHQSSSASLSSKEMRKIKGETTLNPGFSQLFPGKPNSSAVISPEENAKMALPKDEPIYDEVCSDDTESVAAGREEQLETLQHFAECLVMSGHSHNDIINKIISTCQTLRFSPNDVKLLADRHLCNSNFVRAHIMYTCAIAMYKSISRWSDVLPDLNECNLKMKEIAGKMIKSGKMTDVVSKYVLPYMYNMLRDLGKIMNLDAEIIEASCMHRIGLSLSNVSQYHKALKQYRLGIHLLEDIFGKDASKYMVYADLAHSIGVLNVIIGEMNEARTYFKKSIRSKQIVEDFESEKKRIESLATTREKLQNAENQRSASSESDLQKGVLPDRGIDVYEENSASYRSLYTAHDKMMNSKKKLEIVVQMAVCQVKCERPFEGELQKIASICTEVLHYSPGDVKSNADEMFKKSRVVEAYVMYVAASKMYREESHKYKSSVILPAIASCIEKLNEIMTDFPEQNITARIAVILVIPSMNEMLKALQEVKDQVKNEKAKYEARFLNRIGRIHEELREHSKALDQFSEGVKIMKDRFGASISEYWIYGGLLHNMGVTYQEQGANEQAVMRYNAAIQAKAGAKDYPSSEEQKKNIMRSKKTLHACKNLIKKTSTEKEEHKIKTEKKPKAQQQPPYEDVESPYEPFEEDLYETCDGADIPPVPPKLFRETWLLPPRHDVIFLLEKSDNYWQKKDYESALPFLQKLHARQTDPEEKLETFLKILECQVMCNLDNFDLFMLQKVYVSFKLSAHDLTGIADDYIAKSNVIRAYFTYVCLCRIYPCESIGEIRYLIWKMSIIVETMAKRVNFERIAIQHVIPFMYELLADLRELPDILPDNRIQNEAECLNDIGLAYSALYEKKKALNILKTGIDVMEKQFHSEALKFEIYGRMLKSIGEINKNEGKYEEALTYYDKSMLASKRVEVYSEVVRSVKSRSDL